MYPMNFLRNVALNNAHTKYVFLNDLDFIPSYGMHEYLVRLITELSHFDKQVNFNLHDQITVNK